MCDILLATPKATKNGKMIFAKNSDRDPNEAQIVEYIPPMKHEENEVMMTYVTFPQVEKTYGLIISRPWWIWGAEMGVNEHGLAIGNTAVFTNQKRKDRGILGMDMIRLALERMRNAKDALNFIINIIESHGQGGSGSYEHKFLYHNSFIIADPQRAYVLETAGKHWVSKEISKFYSISNILTIKNDWDMASDSVISLAKKSNFDFAKHFSDKFYTYFAHGKERREFTYKALKNKDGEIDWRYIMEILRSHEGGSFDPLHNSMRCVCMHYGGSTKPSQTASSQISILGEDFHLFTGESNPCLSLFKPFFFHDPYWREERAVRNVYDAHVFWWRAELFHRVFIMDYAKHIRGFTKDRDEAQDEIVEMMKYGAEATKRSFEIEEKLIDSWMRKIRRNKSFAYRRIWEKVNRRANIPI